MSNFFSSLRYAIRGFAYVFKTERNFRIHVAVAIPVIILMILFRLRTWEYVFLAFTIVSVLILEIINTVFERVTDVLKPRVHPYAEIMKDMMAAAVLIASVGAIIVGILILGPYIVDFAQDYLYNYYVKTNRKI